MGLLPVFAVWGVLGAAPTVKVLPVEVTGAPPWRAASLQRGLEVAAARSGAFSSVKKDPDTADLFIRSNLERQTVGFALGLRLETASGAVHARVVWPACNSDWRVTDEAVRALTVQAGLRAGPPPALPVCGTTPGQKSGWLALGLASSGVASVLLGGVAMGAGALTYLSITRPVQLVAWGWPFAVEGPDAQASLAPSVLITGLGATAVGLGGLVVVLSLVMGAVAWAVGI